MIASSLNLSQLKKNNLMKSFFKWLKVSWIRTLHAKKSKYMYSIFLRPYAKCTAYIILHIMSILIASMLCRLVCLFITFFLYFYVIITCKLVFKVIKLYVFIFLIYVKRLCCVRSFICLFIWQKQSFSSSPEIWD